MGINNTWRGVDVLADLCIREKTIWFRVPENILDGIFLKNGGVAVWDLDIGFYMYVVVDASISVANF